MTTGLLVMDVDSTLILEEGIDLLGEEAGLGEQVANYRTCYAWRIDFEEALRERVALLKGLPVSVFDRIIKNPLYAWSKEN